ncbi:MAG TPA: transglycosylase SLT domain-containing protein [Stenomitos sp.]
MLASLAMAAALSYTPADPVESFIYQQCLSTYPAAVSKEKARYYTPIIRSKAKKYDIHPLLFASIIWHESNFNPREVSPAGALGLGQVMPVHFSHRGYGPGAWRDPHINLDLAARLYSWYRSRMWATFRGLPNREIAHRTLVAYNMGPLAVSRGIYRSDYSRAILKVLTP